MRAGAALSLFLVSFGTLELTVRAFNHFWPVYDLEMNRYALELKVDAGNPRIGQLHSPSRASVLMGVEVRTNSAGLRDREYPLERSEKGRRILFLGDSITLGWGVPKKDTFEERVESALARKGPVEIVNFGHGNYNTDQEVSLFIERGLRYKPDEVVFFYFVNDAEETPRKHPFEILAHSRFISLAISRFKTLGAKMRGPLYFRNYYSNLYSNEAPGWRGTRSALRELRDVCRREGIAIRVVLLPELHELASYPFASEHAKVTTVLQELGIPYRDLAPRFGWVQDPKSLWVSRDDAHPNAEAHRLIAEYIEDFI